mgnify:CR=1 FL=1
MIYSGSNISNGRGVVAVTGVGMNTEIGKIASLMQNAQKKKKPLQASLDKFSKVLSFVIIGVCVVVFALTKFVNDYEETGVYPENKKITFNEVYEEFIELEGKLTRAYATLKKYDSMYRNHFKPAFGDFYMYSVTQKALERFVNEKSEKYSEEFVKGLFKTLKCIFDYAHRKRYMKHNIFDDVEEVSYASMKLKAMGIEIDSLTDKQKAYMSNWQEGT